MLDILILLNVCQLLVHLLILIQDDYFGDEDLFAFEAEAGVRHFTCKAIENCELLVLEEKVRSSFFTFVGFDGCRYEVS
jgi:hypothetical protein